MVINVDKCVFDVRELSFLGHLITGQGVLPLPNCANAIQCFPQPCMIKSLREFLGLINWYHHPKCCTAVILGLFGSVDEEERDYVSKNIVTFVHYISFENCLLLVSVTMLFFYLSTNNGTQSLQFRTSTSSSHDVCSPSAQALCLPQCLLPPLIFCRLWNPTSTSVHHC